jgi:hypothetical protein
VPTRGIRVLGWLAEYGLATCDVVGKPRPSAILNRRADVSPRRNVNAPHVPLVFLRASRLRLKVLGMSPKDPRSDFAAAEDVAPGSYWSDWVSFGM